MSPRLAGGGGREGGEVSREGSEERGGVFPLGAPMSLPSGFERYPKIGDRKSNSLPPCMATGISHGRQVNKL